MNTQSATTNKLSKTAIVSVGLVIGLVAARNAWSAAPVTPTTNRVQAERAEKVPVVRLVSETDSDQRDVYDPSEVYQGAYDTERIYRVVLGPQTWRVNPRPRQLRDVTCGEARTALSQVGTWYGRILQDGSCVSGDETNWAMGNFLNFQMGPHKTDADL